MAKNRSPESIEQRRAYDRRRAKVKNKAYYDKNKQRVLARGKENYWNARVARLLVKADWRNRNRDRENLKQIQRRRENIEKCLAREKARRESGAVAEYQKKYNEKNRERIKERAARWVRANRAKMREKNARRRCRELNATPSWADHAAIRSVYAECVEISRRTGIPHEVDHIVPLKGKDVCGLHVPCNLQIIPMRLNRAKGNRVAKAS